MASVSGSFFNPWIGGSSSEITCSAQESVDSGVLNIIQDPELSRMAIDHIRSSRFNGDQTPVVEFLKSNLRELPALNEKLVEQSPLLAMMALIINGDPAEDHWRDRAAAAYKKKYPLDGRFESNYAYLKHPTILLSHLLITSGAWKCANPENKAFYDEQMAGSFQGNIAFDKGDQLSREEFALIQQREDPKTPYPILEKLSENEHGYEVKEWCSTPCMVDTKSRVDDVYIASRRRFQIETMNHFIGSLKETSAIISEEYHLPADQLHAVCVIGPYGAGKSRFIEAKFVGKKVTTYSLDELNNRLKSSESSPSDHHFEAMMLTRDLLTQLAEVPALLYENAAIDRFRFSRMTGRDFSSRQLIVEEISPATPEEAVKNFIARESGKEQILSDSRIGAARTSAEDAQKFRGERIESIKGNSRISYTLYCNDAVVATVRDRVLTVAEGQEELFHSLTSTEAMKK
ncbi:MAG: hypothetical protein ACHQUC_08065 [Chlamydiales bacterium]